MQQESRAMESFVSHSLSEQHSLHVGELPPELRFSTEQFEQLWEMHPSEYHTIQMPGGPVQTPRWQQAYGADYHYTGNVNRALPVPLLLEPVSRWTQEEIHQALNGILLNWYDANLKHYIGAHRDSIINMVAGAPIVTISLGDTRVFRLRPWKGKGYRDFTAADGTVFIMPYDTNQAWTHEVPHSSRSRGRRISITIRAFEAGESPAVS